MKQMFGNRVAVSLSTISLLLLPLSGQAATETAKKLAWPKASVTQFKNALKNHPCRSGVAGTAEMRDYCQTQKPTVKTETKWRVSVPQPSMLTIEHKGEMLKIERTTERNVYLINGIELRAKDANSIGELEKMIQAALPNPKKSQVSAPWFQLFVPTANADYDHEKNDKPMWSETKFAIVDLIEHVNKLESCDQYAAFAKTCVTMLRRATKNYIDDRDSSGMDDFWASVAKSTRTEQIQGDLVKLEETLKSSLKYQLGTPPRMQCSSKTYLHNLPVEVAEAQKRVDDCMNYIGKLKNVERKSKTIEQFQAELIAIETKYKEIDRETYTGHNRFKPHPDPQPVVEEENRILEGWQ